ARNVISANGGSGVEVLNGSSGHLIAGNYIGLAADGVTPFGNASHGVSVSAASGAVTVGGTTPGARNVIAANAGIGILLAGVAADDCVIQGNYIGTDASGLTPLGNFDDGIRLAGGGNNNKIGGIAPGAGNVVSANGGDGIALLSLDTTNNSVRGNIIGLGADGVTLMGNLRNGIVLTGASDSQFGGDDAADGVTDGLVAARNVISGNLLDGIPILADAANRPPTNRFAGTSTGPAIPGTLARGNLLAGIAFRDRASNNTVGGVTAGAGNLLSGNVGFGLLMASANVSDNVIQGNRIGTDATGFLPVPN